MSNPELLHPAVAAALDGIDVPFEVLACDESFADTAVFCAHYGVDPRTSANALLLRGKTGEVRYLACVVLAHTRVNVSARLRHRIGSRRVSFASADETRALTNMEIGGVTPIGLPGGLDVLVDARVMDCERVVLGGGNRTSKLSISPAVFGRLPGAEVVEGLAKLAPTD